MINYSVFMGIYVNLRFTANSLYTDIVLFFFSFFLKTSGELNPLRFIFYHLRSTDFEEKIEGQ